MRDAWQWVVRWLECENVWTPTATAQHREILGALLTGPGGSPKLVSDAHLAALALGHGLVLCSTDGDFGGFRDLRWDNPIA